MGEVHFSATLREYLMMSKEQAEERLWAQAEDARWAGLPMLQLSERWGRRASRFL